ncbi:MAG: 50S ribosomal protein L11 methyltransferase [Bacteroidales bacterium]|nr:50S ribosomal protein L11 methyltransferase [Bacteroidales bacterium]
MIDTEQYIEVSIKLSPFSQDLAEILMAELSDLPYDSFVTEEPFLKCYIPREQYRPSDLKVVLSGYDCVAGFNAVMVEGRNWNRNWELSFQPIVVDGVVTVKAPFNTDVPRTRYNIWIDPQMAFGTGYHHTTYMMMQRMLALPMRGAYVCDMGCGTAILGILAAKMGARKVFAVDIDAVAARSAWGNCRWNKVGTRVETACGDASLMQMGTYDVILANIHRNIILEDLPTYARSLRRGGVLLVSGFYDADSQALISAATSLGLSLSRSSSREGWSCLEFVPSFRA